MKKYGFTALMLAVILAVSVLCTTSYVKHEKSSAQTGDVTIVTSFYPMYIAALNIVGGADGVVLENLSEPQTGCLHDFQLTPEDMKLLSTADIFIINGGGIENFMADVASSYPDLTVVEACADLQLLQDADGDNAHAWMSIPDYRVQVQTIAEALGKADPARADVYAANVAVYDEKLAALEDEQAEIRAEADGENVIIFHEAYAYAAQDYGLTVTYDMDLDEERQISAGEVADVIAQVDENGVSLILAEELYGSDMAETVKSERDITVLYLDPLTRGDYDPDSYLVMQQQNIDRIRAWAAGREENR